MKNYQALGEIGEAFALFDAVMTALEPVARVPEALIRGEFPPTNFIHDKEGSLVFEFAVAGYSEDEITLEFKDESMVLTLDPKERKLPEGQRFVQKGIRSGKSRLSAFVPLVKYKVDNAEATLKDGILKVVIPMREEVKPMTLKIKPNK